MNEIVNGIKGVIMFRATTTGVILGVLILCPNTLAWAQPVAEDELLRTRIETLRSSANPQIGPARIEAVKFLAEFYESRGFRPVWRNTKNTAELVAAIRGSERDGLNPADYLLKELKHRLNVRPEGTAEFSPQQAELDILLTESLLRLAYHFRYGKVDAQDLDSDWNFSRPLSRENSLKALEEILGASSLELALSQLLPDHDVYRNVRMALDRYRQIKAAGGWQPVPAGPTLRSGDTGTRVTALRQRLSAEGFLSLASTDSDTFDAELVEVIKRFQKNNFLSVDGAVGPGTLTALNVPVETRIDQLRVNLERARWILHDIETRFIVVDIAGYETFYYNDSEPVWSSRVQVGKPFRATPVFRDKMTYLVFNPTWTLPPTIIAEDVIPAVRRDVSYLSSRNIKVLDRSGKVIDPKTLDWSKFSGKNFPYILRQDPGPRNALGQIKFMFPNPHFVYLHDTPSKSLFNRSGRAFSSGCIRVEKPVELAELLLSDPENWNQQKIRDEFKTGKTRTVRLKEPVPILLFYWTARVYNDGTVGFKQDIYGRDAAVLKALDGDFKIHKPHKSRAAEESNRKAVG